MSIVPTGIEVGPEVVVPGLKGAAKRKGSPRESTSQVRPLPATVNPAKPNTMLRLEIPLVDLCCLPDGMVPMVDCGSWFGEVTAISDSSR